MNHFTITLTPVIMSIRKVILATSVMIFIFCQGCFGPKGDINMDLTLEVSEEKILGDLADHNKDSIFVTALARAHKMQPQSASDFTTLFGQAFEETDPNAKLSYFFSTINLKDQINLNSSNSEVLLVLHNEVTETISSCAEVLKARLAGYGLSQKAAEIEVKGNRIYFKLSGIDNPDRIRKLLQSRGKLEFWETYECAEVISYFAEANEFLKSIIISEAEEPSEKAVPETETGVGSLLAQIEKDTVAMAETDGDEVFARENPLFSVLRPNLKNDGIAFPGSVIGVVHMKDTAKVNAYLKIDQVRSIFPRDLKLFWSLNPYPWEESKTLYELHAIKITTPDGKAPLDGSVITSAKADSRYRGAEVTTMLSMNDEGSELWKVMTKKNLNRNIAVVIDGYVLSSPRVMAEITGGETEISGDLTIEESEDLSTILSSGALPCEVQIVYEAINKGE